MSKALKEEVKYELLGIALITLALLGFTSLLTLETGAAGHTLSQIFSAIAGKGRYLLPFFLIFLGIKIMQKRINMQLIPQLLGFGLLLVTILSFLHLKTPLSNFFQAGKEGEGGGLIGALGSYLLVKYFDLIGSYIILTSFLIVSVILLTGLPLSQLSSRMTRYFGSTGKKIISGISNFIFEEVREVKSPVIVKPEKRKRSNESPENLKIDEVKIKPLVITADGKTFCLPSTSLLSPIKAKDQNLSEKEVADKINILEQTLSSFGINARVTQVTVGPAITRYETQPPAGVKVSRIVGLADDIALAMAVPHIRFETPIPGKAAIGIEVPNREISTVHLRELLESKEFDQSTSRLTVALGKDIAGTPVVADLANMPHLLVAGATGSGKSVCINTLIVSILFKAAPDETKFILIDPKMVELTNYNDIPHLIAPVVTNPKKAAGVLHWAVKEMERRYELFASTGVKDMACYNQIQKQENEGMLPFIVIIIDELADLMMIAPVEVEDSICRLAQMARAAGIHLVIATQRPSVDVITGLIKANIPSRISFAVSSQMDSRTILDTGGAEKLLGKGDMLFFPVGASKPVRVQGAFLSDKDIERLVAFLKEQCGPAYDQQVKEVEFTPKTSPNSEEDDDLLPQAVQLFIEQGCASISMLQRRFRIGYARAARLVDIMEQRGIIGKFDGSKPRPILMTYEQCKQMFNKK